MRKVLFFTEVTWAYGSIHFGLIRRLYSKGIFCTILNWAGTYTQEEMDQIIESHDAIVTTPTGVEVLRRVFNSPPEKLLCVVHGEHDYIAANTIHKDLNDSFTKIAGVANSVVSVASKYNIKKPVSLLRCGVDFDYFYTEPSKNLNTIGYAAAYSRKVNDIEIKRGHLANTAATDCGLKFKTCNFYHFLSMPAFYKLVDCVIQSSTMETIGLPMLEAACAGRLTIGTEIGYIYEFNPIRAGGIVVPTDEVSFVNKTKEVLNYYKENPDHFHQRCKDIQEYARYNYDWEYFLDDWVSFLS